MPRPFNPPSPMVRRDSRLALEGVVTLVEGAERWNRDRKTLMIQINKGNLIARQSGATWLIATASLIALWGDPEEHENRTVLS